MSFRVEYKRPAGTTMFQRNVRFHVDITCATPSQDTNQNGNIDKTINIDKPTIYCITFTLISGTKPIDFFILNFIIFDFSIFISLFLHCSLFILPSGPIRRFKRICDVIQVQILGRRTTNQNLHSPRMGRRPTRELSDTSSCGSCGSDSLSPTSTTLRISEDTVSLAAAVVNTSTTNLTGALSRCKSDQDATADIFDKEKMPIERRPSKTSAITDNSSRIISKLINGRRMSIETKLTTDKV